MRQLAHDWEIRVPLSIQNVAAKTPARRPNLPTALAEGMSGEAADRGQTGGGVEGGCVILSRTRSDALARVLLSTPEYA